MDNNDYMRSWSKDHKGKDKKKKKKHEDRSRSKSNKKRKDRDREYREYDRYDDDKQDRYREKSKDRKDKYVDRDRDRERDRERDKGRDKDKERERERDRWDERDKEKSRDRQKEKERSREKEKNKNQEDREDKEKEKQVQEGTEELDIKQDERPSPLNDRSEKKKKKRSVSEKKNKKEKKSYDRSRSRDRKKKKKEYKNDYDKRRKRRERSSSSSSSNRSGNVSDDPEQVQKLAQMKAAKELVSSKTDRKLYLGNLPPNITSQQLMDMLNGALKKMEINTDVEGDSIVSSWISPDGVGHYAFVEFRTAQEATNGLTLNGASLFGYQLKLGRPKQYIEYNKTLLSEMGTDKNLETILKKIAALKGTDELPPIEDRIVCPPSKIIVLKHLVSIEELAIDEEYEEIKEDIMEMAKKFGTVISVVIPRPHQVIDLEHVQKRVKGLGLIFIEYETLGAGRFARSQFVLKEFSGKPVACSFFDEHKFKEQDFDIQEKVIIDF